MMSTKAMDSKKLIEGIGSGIRQRRKAAGMTIQQLAELADIDAGFLTYIETGKKRPSLITVGRLAEALGISLSELFKPLQDRNAGPQYKLERQLHSLLHDRTAGQLEEITGLLRQLRDPKKVRAIRQLIGPKN